MIDHFYSFVVGGGGDGVCKRGEEGCFSSLSFEIIYFLCFYGDS